MICRAKSGQGESFCVPAENNIVLQELSCIRIAPIPREVVVTETEALEGVYKFIQYFDLWREALERNLNDDKIDLIEELRGTLQNEMLAELNIDLEYASPIDFLGFSNFIQSADWDF